MDKKCRQHQEAILEAIEVVALARKSLDNAVDELLKEVLREYTDEPSESCAD
jgi:hypothetical protein